MWMVLILLVALRKESVDRNTIISYTIDNERKVALRKESVDRNGKHSQGPLHRGVALRKESVDRNPKVGSMMRAVTGRSPQGERG